MVPSAWTRSTAGSTAAGSCGGAAPPVAKNARAAAEEEEDKASRSDPQRRELSGRPQARTAAGALPLAAGSHSAADASGRASSNVVSLRMCAQHGVLQRVRGARRKDLRRPLLEVSLRREELDGGESP
jgi:hypothetical protein